MQDNTLPISSGGLSLLLIAVRLQMRVRCLLLPRMSTTSSSSRMALLAQLKSLELTDISLFDFAENVESTENHERSLFAGCKSFPRDQLWPLEPVWKVFNLLTGAPSSRPFPLVPVAIRTTSTTMQTGARRFSIIGPSPLPSDCYPAQVPWRSFANSNSANDLRHVSSLPG